VAERDEALSTVRSQRPGATSGPRGCTTNAVNCPLPVRERPHAQPGASASFAKEPAGAARAFSRKQQMASAEGIWAGDVVPAPPGVCAISGSRALRGYPKPARPKQARRCVTPSNQSVPARVKIVRGKTPLLFQASAGGGDFRFSAKTVTLEKGIRPARC